MDQKADTVAAASLPAACRSPVVNPGVEERGARSSPRLSGLAALKAAKRKELAAKEAREELVQGDTRVGAARAATGLLYSPEMLLHRCVWDSEHIESPERLRRVVERCRELELVDRCVAVEAREATDRELLLYHSQGRGDTS